jgi:hypothetical protein
MMKYLFILLFLMAFTSHGQTEIPADSLQEVLEDAEIEDEEFPAWEKHVFIGLSFGNSLELNCSSGTFNKAFSSTNCLDLRHNYLK